MNGLHLVCLLLVSVTTVLASSGWTQFKAQHGKVYEDLVDERMRQSIFAKNKLEIERFNEQEAEEAGFELGLNHMADWTSEEYNRVLGFKLPQGKGLNLTNSAKAEAFLNRILADKSTPIPDSVDWRKVPGRVSPVKDQGQCGSCWAFATTGVLEGQELKVTQEKDLIALSEQNLVDCVEKDYGCRGGLMTDALDKIKQQGGIMDEMSYPYTAITGKSCKFNKSKAIMTDSGYALIKEGDENKLKEVVAKFGPVAVAIHAPLSLQFYKWGVFKSIFCKSSQASLNHGVLVVGYGTTSKGVDYWLVKNSWNSVWGDGGYFKMARNRNNMCGIATMATIPVFD